MVRPPAPDRDQRNVEPGGELRHPVEDVGVAREVHLAASADEVADRSARAARRRPARVVGPRGANGNVADSNLVALQDLLHALEAARPHEPAEASREDHERLAGKAFERAQVEVVEVPVRDQDRVGAADLGERPGPEQVSRSPA